MTVAIEFQEERINALEGKRIIDIEAEWSSLLSYFLGIFIGQGSLLLIVLYFSEHVGNILKNKNLVSGILIGIGAAFSWVALIDI